MLEQLRTPFLCAFGDSDPITRGADTLLLVSSNDFDDRAGQHRNAIDAAKRAGVSRIVYTPGLFLNAELDKASEDNERSALVIETAGARIGVVQIAGLIARRYGRQGAFWREQQKAGVAVDARVINTSSGAGLMGSVGQTAYAAANEPPAVLHDTSAASNL